VSAVITIDRAIFEIEFKWIEGYRDALVEIWTTPTVVITLNI